VSGRSAVRADSFWEQVNAALDARRDPLEDPRVQQLLTERPERFAQLAAMRSGLARVARTGRRRVLLRTLAAAVVLIVAVPLGPRVTRQAKGTQTTTAAIATPDTGREHAAALEAPVAALQVLAFRAEVTVEGPQGRRTTTFDGRRARLHSEACSERQDVPFFVATTSVALP
jgi:hypothetical protein